MNIRLTYALLTTFVAILVIPAYGADEIPIIVSTDNETYDHQSKILVTGQVDNVRTGIPVTYKVTNPMGTIVTVGQNNVDENGSFEFVLNTKGNIWKYDGEYRINVQYGSDAVSNFATVNLQDGVMPSNAITPPESTRISECAEMNIVVYDDCVPYSLTSGMLMSSTVDENSLKLYVNTEEGDGILELTEIRSILIGTHTILVDNQQWDDVEIIENSITVMYPAGTETIEVFSAQIVPEFGTIAAIVLAVAITSVIAVTARTRLGIQSNL